MINDNLNKIKDSLKQNSYSGKSLDVYPAYYLSNGVCYTACFIASENGSVDSFRGNFYTPDRLTDTNIFYAATKSGVRYAMNLGASEIKVYCHERSMALLGKKTYIIKRIPIQMGVVVPVTFFVIPNKEHDQLSMRAYNFAQDGVQRTLKSNVNEIKRDVPHKRWGSLKDLAKELQKTEYEIACFLGNLGFLRKSDQTPTGSALDGGWAKINTVRPRNSTWNLSRVTEIYADLPQHHWKSDT